MAEYVWCMIREQRVSKEVCLVMKSKKCRELKCENVFKVIKEEKDENI